MDQKIDGIEVVSKEDFEANFSAVLYVISEQHALIGRLMENLIRGGNLKASDLERITGIYGERDVVSPVYEDIYRRYADYYVAFKQLAESLNNKPQDDE